MTVVAADKLYELITSSEIEGQTKLNSVNELKTHVKKDFVDISQVPKYLEALSIGVDIHELGILLSSFSVIAHLVKRVSMQDPSGAVLKNQAYLVLPIIIERMGDPKSSTRNSSKRALEAYWFSAPDEVEEAVIELALCHRHTLVIQESIQWLHHIITNVSPHFKLTNFSPAIVKLLTLFHDQYQNELIESIRSLFKDYYSIKHNRLYKFDLVRELDNQKIPLNLKDSLLKDIGSSKSDAPQTVHHRIDSNSGSTENEKRSHPPKRVNSNPGTSSLVTRVKQQPETSRTSKSSVFNISSGKSNESGIQISTGSRGLPSSVKVEQTKKERVFDLSPELESIIANTFVYGIDTTIQEINVQDSNEILRIVSELQGDFMGKETETNWLLREKGIIKLRSLVRGNSPQIYKDEFILCMKDISAGICKGVSSLRTTLCTHACQLVKEMVIVIKSDFDSLVDHFMPALLKLCSATKHISSSNANIALCAIFINASYNHKLLDRILIASKDKNVQPRAYCCTWLQILLVRFHEYQSFKIGHGSPPLSGPEVTCTVLTKLLSDPNPNVRQVAKACYWCFFDKFPSEAESLLSRLETNVVKVFQRSKPNKVDLANLPATLSHAAVKRPRPSIRESIISRNKEIRAKQRENLSLSRPSSRVSSNSPTLDEEAVRKSTVTSSGDVQRVNKLGHSKRVSSTSSIKKDIVSQSSSDMQTVGIASTRKASSLSIDSRTEEPLNTDLRGRIGHKQEVHKEKIELVDVKKPERVNSFKKEVDPILKFLSSNNLEFITEGVGLLKYAIMCDEQLPDKIKFELKKIGIKHEELLKPLFSGSDGLFKKSFQYFLPEDFLRVSSILRHPFNDTLIEILLDIMNVDEFYGSIMKLISFTTNLNNIVDNSDLTMQVIKYKSTIVHSMIKLLEKGLNKIPISDTHLSQLLNCLFELVGILKSTGLYETFSALLKKFYSINPPLFESELQMLLVSTKEEIELIVGIDGLLDLSNAHSGPQFASMFDLTKVVPDSNLGKLSPLKGPSDLTMLMPVAKDPDSAFTIRPDKNNGPDVLKNVDNVSSAENRASDLDLKEGNNLQYKEKSEDESGISEIISHDKLKIEIESNDMQLDQDVLNNHGEVSRVTSAISNVETSAESSNHASSAEEESRSFFMEQDELSKGRNSDLFSKFNQKEVPDELEENFAQVKIAESDKKQSESESALQNFISKVDPLNKVATKNKPISIFSDQNSTGSPQKVKDYDYSDLNWFNFQLARYAMVRSPLKEDDYTISAFESLCKSLGAGEIKGQEFVQLLYFLQSTQKFESVFSECDGHTGYELIEDSLWDFFDNCDGHPIATKLSCLIILKQLLINKRKVDEVKLWDLLVGLSSEYNPPMSELSQAISETFDEMLTGIYSSAIIIEMIIQTLTSESREYRQRGTSIFLLECLSKVLSLNSINLIIDEVMMKRVSDAIYLYLGDDSVEVRRYTVLSYGKLLRAVSIFNLHLGKSMETNLMDEILGNLSLPQRKLVEYYSLN